MNCNLLINLSIALMMGIFIGNSNCFLERLTNGFKDMYGKVTGSQIEHFHPTYGHPARFHHSKRYEDHHYDHHYDHHDDHHSVKEKLEDTWNYVKDKIYQIADIIKDNLLSTYHTLKEKLYSTNEVLEEKLAKYVDMDKLNYIKAKALKKYNALFDAHKRQKLLNKTKRQLQEQANEYMSHVKKLASKWSERPQELEGMSVHIDRSPKRHHEFRDAIDERAHIDQRHRIPEELVLTGRY